MTARAKALLWAGVALCCLVMVFVKVRLESGAELTLARAARDRGERDLAGLHYRRAIRWYTPLSSSVEAAVGELSGLAQEREGAGAPADALALYRDLRGALYAVRHLTEPFREVRDQVEERIADLMAREPPTMVEDRQKTTAERRTLFLTQLRGVHAPHVGWTVALLLGFFGWVSAAAVFFWRGFSREGKLLPRPALFWGSLLVACFALWVAGMTQA